MQNEESNSINNNTFQYYRNLGLTPIPLQSGSKIPHIKWKQFQTRKPTDAEYRKWESEFSGCNIGLLVGEVHGLVVVDMDSQAAYDRILNIGENCDTTLVKTSRGYHLYFRYPEGKFLRSHLPEFPDTDFKVSGYVVAGGSQHESGAIYDYVTTPEKAGIAAMPETLICLLEHDPVITEVVQSDDETDLDDRIRSCTSSLRGALVIKHELSELAAAKEYSRNDTLFKVSAKLGKLVKAEIADRDTLESLLTDISMSIGLTTQEIGATITSGIGTAIRTDAGTTLQPPDSMFQLLSGKNLPDLDIRKFECTDVGNSQLFALLYEGILKYNWATHEWLIWNGNTWQPDRTASVVQRLIEVLDTRALLASYLSDADELAKERNCKNAHASKTQGRLQSILSISQSNPLLEDDGDGWDERAELIAFKNGVFDLEADEFRPGKPEDRITKFIDYDYQPDVQCPLWLRTVDQISGNDPEWDEFVQKAIGYSISGLTNDRIIFMCYGQGGNGKSLMLNTLTSILGSYGYTTPFTTFDMNTRNIHPQNIASLMGKRLVVVAEANEHSVINTERLKQLTGEQWLNGRFTYQDEFVFLNQSTFWMMFNHRPIIHDQSFGLWSRICVIPFDVTFDERNANTRLIGELKDEAVGILAWAVEGARKWNRSKMQLQAQYPKRIISAIADYRNDSDHFSEFLEDVILEDATCNLAAGAAYDRYLMWCGNHSVSENEVLSGRSFGGRMALRFTKKKTREGRFYSGIRCREKLSDL